MRVSSKTILVTGGGNGIGRELVLQLLERGATVVAVDLNKTGLDETMRLAGERRPALRTYLANISVREEIESLEKQLTGQSVHFDALINNAGIIQPFLRVHDLDYASIDRVMNVNFFGTLYVTKTFLPHLLGRPEAHIVNVSSMGGFLPVPGQSIYGASKAAVKLFSEGLYAELKETSVRVTVVFPGAVDTNIAANSGITAPTTIDPSGKRNTMKSLPPSKAASQILDGMENDRFRILVGSDSRFMDFMYRLSPGRATDLIYKKMKSLLK